MTKALIDFDILLYNIGYTTEDQPEEIAFIRTDEFITNILLSTDATDYTGYLSDSKENNFRYKIDPEYKAHRTQPKPKHYEAIKEYLITAHDAKIAYGQEADDSLCQVQYRDYRDVFYEAQPLNTICCTIDKDILQGVPGHHYSWPIYRRGEIVREAQFIETSEDAALRFHYFQLLKGDKSDNIFGIDGLGDKKIAKLFEGVPTEDLYEVVSAQYMFQYKDEWKDKLVKNSQLLWIKRTDEENELTPTEIKLREEE